MIKKNKCKCGNDKAITSKKCKDCHHSKTSSSIHPGTWGRRTKLKDAEDNNYENR